MSLKLAQSELICDIRGEYPVLLLDDIMSELDSKRRAYLSGKIMDKQVILTCTDIDDTAKEMSAALFRVENGKVFVAEE